MPIVWLALGVSAALLWYVMTPPFEAPDENAHFDFVRYLAAERRLPDALPASRVGWDSHEWIQPPLYYVLLAPVVDAIGANAVPAVPINPNNRFLGGTSKRTFTWDGQRSTGTDAVFLARLASLVLGMLTLLFIYRATATVLGSKPQAAIAAGGLTLVPQFSFLVGALSNDTLAAALSAATIALLVTLWTTPTLSMITAVLVGLCAGLAVITKISASFLLPMIPLAAFCRFRGQPARGMAFLFVAGLSAAAAAGWYFVRNVILFGDPLANRFKLEIIADVAAPWNLKLNDPYFYTRFTEDLFLSFWGSFGWLTISPSAELLMVYAIITGLLAGVASAYLVGTAGLGHRGRVERMVLAGAGLGLGAFAAWKVESPSLVLVIPGGTLLDHIEVAIAAAAISFVILILRAPVSAIDRNERQIALILAVGIVTMLAELVLYNLSWPASQARLMYPALAPIVIVLALAVRHAGGKLRSLRATRWLIPLMLAILGAGWILSLSAGFRGFHASG